VTILLAVVAARSAVDVVGGWIVHAGAVAAGLAALAALVCGIAAAVWRGVKWAMKMQASLDKVEQRSRELAPNGGGSIKDATAQTCARLGALEDAVAGVRSDVADVRLDVATVAERLDRHLLIVRGE